MNGDRGGGGRGAASAGRIDMVSRVAVLLMTVLMALILMRVGQLQLAPSEELQQHIQQRISRRVQNAPRGDVLDRRGRVLAGTRTGYRLFVDPTVIRPPFGDAVQRIAQVVQRDEGEVAERIVGRISRNDERAAEGRPPLRYVSIGGVLPDWQIEAAERLKIPGVHLERRSVREIPAGDPLAALVGVVGIDHNGLTGAELIYDHDVQPQPGHLDYVRDASGRAMWVEAAGYKPPVRGSDVRLSIDLEIQQIALEELKRGVADADAEGGRLLMVDPRTGDILAMVDYVREMEGLSEPPARVKGKRHLDEPPPEGVRYRTIKPDLGRKLHPALARNRVVEDVYEPGSTFKAFMWSTVTERGLAKPEEVFNTYNGIWQTPYGRTIKDVVPKEALSWGDVLVFSSNIGMVQGTARLTFQQMRSDVVRFGFGQPTNVGLPGESPGIVTAQKHWTKFTQTSVASGYEVAVTPLQIVRAFCAFARTGDMAGTMPSLKLRASEPGSAEGDVRVRVLQPWVAELARNTMSKVARIMEERSRARWPDEPPTRYSMFGKSGTAEIHRPDGLGYFKNQHNSSFLLGAPTEDPRIVMVVVIDDPGPDVVRKKLHYGSSTAGPVARRVVRRTLEYLGVPPTEPMPAPEKAGATAHHEDRE